MLEVKRGMLKYYHRGVLSKKWVTYRFVLYDTSLLAWYTDIKHKDPDRMVFLKLVREYICVGPYASCLPDFPNLKNECDQVALIAFPSSVEHPEQNIIWLLCQDQDELNSWMKAIVQTLPHAPHCQSISSNVASETFVHDVEVKHQVESSLGLNSTSTSNEVMIKTDRIIRPTSTGLTATRLIDNKIHPINNPLHKKGYRYGDTLWGTGEGWRIIYPHMLPSFAGIAGLGYRSDDDNIVEDEFIQPSIDDESDQQEVIENPPVEEEEEEDIVAIDLYPLEDLNYDYSDDQEENGPNEYEDEREGLIEHIAELLDRLGDDS